MKHYKLIIFDLDDTLFDYKETEKHAIINTCKKFCITFEGDLYSQYRNANNIVRKKYSILTWNNIEQFRALRIKSFFSLINIDNINPNDFIDEYLKHSTVGILIEGVQETLERLDGIIKVVATNGTNFPRQNKLENSSIAKFFNSYFSAENLGVAKPNSEFFLKIIKQFNLHYDKVLVVGDDYLTDIQGAIGLGLDCCWFNYRNKKQTAVLPSNVYRIQKFNQLINIIKRGKYG